MKTTKTTDRRKFLLAAGLGGAGAAAVALGSRRNATRVAEAAPAAEDSASGYRVTEHILKYYKTTEV